MRKSETETEYQERIQKRDQMSKRINELEDNIKKETLELNSLLRQIRDICPCEREYREDYYSHSLCKHCREIH